MKASYVKAAREFAKLALSSSESPVVIQNAHKAAEFALTVYAMSKKLVLPRDHWQAKNLAYRVGKKFGEEFAELLRLYLGAYRLEDGEKTKRAKALMTSLLKELEEDCRTVFLA